MAWLRFGDNSADNPIVLRVFSLVRRSKTMVPECDVATNEVLGWVMRCASSCAGHWQDYAISEGNAWHNGGPRTDRLIQLAKKAGYITQERKGGETLYRVVDDPAFIHMKLKAEKEFEDQRKTDNSNDSLVKVVKARDGDVCRYCGIVVNWNDRVGGIGATYDHRVPGQKAQTPDHLVVSCRSCNAARGNRDNADEIRPLRPVPEAPYFSTLTAEFLAERGITVTASDTLRPGQYHRPDPARDGSDPAPAGSRATDSDPASDIRREEIPADVTPPAPASQTGQRTSETPGGEDLQVPAGRQSPDRDGSGRDGSGRVGTGGPRSPEPRRNRRSRRTTRGRPPADTTHDTSGRTPTEGTTP